VESAVFAFLARPAAWLTALVVLQLADLVCTWLLLSGGLRHDVVEANPVARALLEQGGWGSLTLFKVACSTIAVAAVYLVLRWRPALGRVLLAGLVLLVLGVVGQGVSLLACAEDPEFGDMKTEQAYSDTLDDHLVTFDRYRARRTGISHDLLVGRVSFSLAVANLRDCLRETAPTMSATSRYSLPATDDSAILAAYLVFHAGLLPDQPPGRFDTLLKECRRQFPNLDPIDPRNKASGYPLPWLAPELRVPEFSVAHL
jgi:hypothetical protein